MLAATGRPCNEFGARGRVDLMEGLPHAKRGERDYLNALTYSVQSPPIVVRDVVITPASISDRRIMRESIPGWIRGFNVRTGELEWVFHTVPQAGDEGVETWKNESWRYSRNTNDRFTPSVDELPTSAPARPECRGAAAANRRDTSPLPPRSRPKGE